jgi:glycosyltransferase involved in cell wall biosynthesis
VRILFATGIYPPDIGGPATYVRALAKELIDMGHEVIVVAYGAHHEQAAWPIFSVSREGGVFARWRRYARVLRENGTTCDVIYAFSSVSCGVPLLLSRVKGPKKVLRLGGDFAWERYTDKGGRKTLRQFHSSIIGGIARLLLWPVLYQFDLVVFSSLFQRQLTSSWFVSFPRSAVVENALPVLHSPEKHEKNDPFKILFVGRIVAFKNLRRLLEAIARIPHASLTIVGDGPERQSLIDQGRELQLQGRIAILPPVSGDALRETFSAHDLLILPSLTEISPNTALEARSTGIPVLLTEEHGLSDALAEGMCVRRLISASDITKAILEVDHAYAEWSKAASQPVHARRDWRVVAEETLKLFQ